MIALERGALDEYSLGNPLGFVDLATDDVTWFDFTPGPQLRVEGIETVRNLLAPLTGQIPQHTHELVDPRVQVYGDIAIPTFHRRGTTTEGEPTGEWKATSIHH